MNWDRVAESLIDVVRNPAQPLELRRRLFFFMLQCIGAVGEA